MLEKTYDSASVEPRIYQSWEDAAAFAAGAGAEQGADSYCIVIPPPNVTGSLHMGHALNNTLQDVLIRFERMRGKDVLWQPGMDHAGIATQMVVERQLMEAQEPGRRDMGREKFIEKVWEWKAHSGGTIFNQLKRLGASCDWSRERFTMDEGLSDAVLKVFVALFKKGLIYRDKRLVNWDPNLVTAISDLEVQQIEVNGHLWHFQYPIEGEPGRTITVATTRPETMLGDTAVAVHPDDERYTDLIGKHAVLPLVGRRIAIVADDYADPEAGSGAVKITPAHDFNDFEVGKRHDLAMINILNPHAEMDLKDNDDFLADVPASDELSETLNLHGLDRFAARARVVEMMEARGLCIQIDEHTHMVPHGDRSNGVVEPYLTDQWFADAETLAKPAIASVREGRTNFVPKNWEKTYYDWMENIQPWCISRQLWWGHQIPAWYGPDGEIFVEANEADALAAATAHYGQPTDIIRDEDVLDTWFSSALWPFSTLGWPDETAELKRYYQTDVLITGFDIIFFWVARMMMMGLEFMDEEPFHTVYIHALVRDENGQKMSKSKGNIIDPLELIDEFGADALRFTLAAMAAQGRDIKLAKTRVAGYRNFATKIWNAVRFTQINGCARTAEFDPAAVNDTLNRWIVAETAKTVTSITGALEAYKFNEAAGAAYTFVWGTFCDWYLELSKPLLLDGDDAKKAETQATAAWVIDQILTILHPFMPFITEELWARTGEVGPKRSALLAMSAWPDIQTADTDAADEINWLVDLISKVRSVRSEMNIPPSTKAPLVITGADETFQARLSQHEAAIFRQARVDAISFADGPPAGSAQIVVGNATVSLPLAGVIDLTAEQARLEKAIDKIDKDIAKIDNKLSNPKFLERAPEDVVESERQKRDEASTLRAKMEAALNRVKGAA